MTFTRKKSGCPFYCDICFVSVVWIRESVISLRHFASINTDVYRINKTFKCTKVKFIPILFIVLFLLLLWSEPAICQRYLLWNIFRVYRINITFIGTSGKITLSRLIVIFVLLRWSEPESPISQYLGIGTSGYIPLGSLIVIFVLLRWSETKSAISPRHIEQT